ncbi:DinG family ATP-dependent helicase YoaA [Cutibacterium acnes JCM 18918]|nr:DinG family ATP-dependent helicase YoaA [Cutibacterium acnes JCM 18918]
MSCKPVYQAASKDLSPAIVTTTAKRAMTWLDDDVGATC